MRTDLLRSLLTVIRVGSLRRAADELFVTQPALSQRLNLLEQELGLTLLVRTRAGVRPTPIATRLMDRIHAVLAAEDALRRDAKAIRAATPITLRIGGVGTAMRLLIPIALVPFQKANPHIELELMEELPSFDLVRGLRDGILDLAILATFSDQAPPSGLICQTVLSLPVRVGIPEGHELLRLPSVSTRDLLLHRLILPAPGLLMHSAADHNRHGGQRPENDRGRRWSRPLASPG
jgi:DNA-binding transcriptional LysR family regulator